MESGIGLCRLMSLNWQDPDGKNRSFATFLSQMSRLDDNTVRDSLEQLPYLEPIIAWTDGSLRNVRIRFNHATRQVVDGKIVWELTGEVVGTLPNNPMYPYRGWRYEFVYNPRTKKGVINFYKK